MERKNVNNDAQISLDFLVGITIFLLAFIFVLAFIPGMFAPYQSNSDELTMAADNAAAVLVENMLADDQHIDSSSGTTIVVNHSSYNPGLIDQSKYEDLMNKLGPSSPETVVSQTKKSLGLEHGKDGLLYNLEIALSTTANPDPIYTTPISPDGLPSGSNVGQSKRFVYVVKNDADDVPSEYTMAILTVRVW